jgi:hypothetical protein
MSIRITRVLSFAEYVELGEDAVKRGFYRNDKRIFTPGMAWFQPFYFDPFGELKAFKRSGFRETPMCERGDPFLSVHYWRDWADKRAPICVVGPNGEQWEVDRKSSNGDGWIVTGELPTISCSPSIVLNGYHGYLRNGEFTASL